MHVALLAEGWIEMSVWVSASFDVSLIAPSYGVGLKSRADFSLVCSVLVVLFIEDWIETGTFSQTMPKQKRMTRRSFFFAQQVCRVT